MAVLVTGGAGFVGAYVVRDLLDRGEEVVVFDAVTASPALDTAVPGWRDQGRLRLVRGTIASPWRLLQSCRDHDVDAVVHLASPLTSGVNEDLRAGLEDICCGTANVLEAARLLGLRRVVWTSSISVFGPPSRYGEVPIGDDAELRPTSFYGSCKALCEQMGAVYREHHDVDSIALRLTIVYGPGRKSGVTSFVSEAVEAAAAGRPVRVAYGDQVLNWQYVDDVAGMLLAALDAPRPPRTVYTTTGDVRSIRDVGDAISRLVPGADVHVEDGRFDGTDGLTEFPVNFDDTGLREDLGFRWQCDIERGVRDTLRILRETPATVEAR